MKLKVLFATLLLLSSTQSFARQCWNHFTGQSGIADNINYDLSTTFNHGNNTAGQIITLTSSLGREIKASCYAGSGDGHTYRSYTTTEQIVQTIGQQKYLRINEYLLGSMQITDDWAGTFYPPATVKMGYHPNVDLGWPFPVRDTNLVFRVKVDKSFIGSISIPSNRIFTVYVTTASNDVLKFPVYTITYTGRIIAPQSCKINSGTTLEVPFGNISANEFVQAGAGNKPNSITVQTKKISVQCSNMQGVALLSMRLEAEKAQGDMMVSNIEDIGFKLSDINDKVLIPNNINSILPFTLQNDYADVFIKAWPVSITGKKPIVGPFNSRGYLRIDFQ